MTTMLLPSLIIAACTLAADAPPDASFAAATPPERVDDQASPVAPTATDANADDNVANPSDNNADGEAGDGAGNNAAGNAKIDPVLEKWLDKIEAKSKQTKTLTAAVRYDRIQGLFGDEQRRFGTLIYEAGPPAKFAIHFEKIHTPTAGDPDKFASRPQNRWYVFDGTWLVEKLEDKKQFFKWQVVPPNAKPAAANALALGKGPFVVPVGARKDLMLEKFNVSLVEPAPDKDPENSVHLKLEPKDKRRSQFTEIHLWYDRDTLVPLRARTVDESENESVVHLIKPEVNAEIDPAKIDTAEPKERGWRVEITPWGK